MASCATVYQVPGPKGATGTAGTNGTDGVNAFSTVATAFIVPSGVDLTTTTSFSADNVDAFVTMAAAHNLTTGAIVTLANFSDGGFDLSDVVVTVLSATQFSYPAAGLFNAGVIDGTGEVTNIRLPVTFTNNEWVVIGQFIEIGGPQTDVLNPAYPNGVGTFEVTGVSSTLTYIRNSYDGTTGSYPNNVAAGIVVPIGIRVGPAGMQGGQGVAGVTGAPVAGTYITQVALVPPGSEQPMSTLATGYVKNTTGTGVLSVQAVPIPIADGGTAATTAATARTSLSAAPSNATYIVQTADGGLSAEQALSALATGYVKVTTATGVLSSQAIPIPAADGGTGGTLPVAYGGTGGATAAIARESLGKLVGRYGVIGYVTGINFQTATTDWDVVMLVSGAYIVTGVYVTSTASLPNATGGLSTGAALSGVVLCLNQVLSAITSSAKYDSLVLEAATGTDVFTTTPLKFYVTTPEVGAATGTVLILGINVS